MADVEVQETETVVISDVSSDDESGRELLPERIMGVRNVGTPPFVTKLYKVVNDKGSDSIISWVSSPNGATSFAIWNEVDFIINVLPLMSKSNSFDSFISQLNSYGFRKVSWDRREYANEWFQEGHPHLLKHIKRRNKQTVSENEKMTREIKRIESESKKVDDELHALKAYVDNTISNQQKILQAIANTIQSTFNHHRSHVEVVDIDNDTRSFTFVGQQGNEMSELDESSLAPSCKMPTEEVNTN